MGDQTMSAAENKAILQRFFDAANANDLDGMLALATDDIVVHTPIPGIASGREGFRGFMGLYFGAFPEQRIDVHDLIADRDRVVVRHTHHVTHGGDFVGMPPTGKQAVISGIEVFRLVDGKIAELWHQDDLLSLLQQLGAA
jgi:steroid delta-isomerase-like uncharacterized protein